MNNEESKCPRCGEPNDTHTWFGRVLDNPLVWHAHAAVDKPSNAR